MMTIDYGNIYKELQIPRSMFSKDFEETNSMIYENLIKQVVNKISIEDKPVEYQEDLF